MPSALVRFGLAKLLILTVLLIIALTFPIHSYAADTTPGEPVSKDNYDARVHSAYTFQGLESALLCEGIGISPVGACPGVTTDENGKPKVLVYQNGVPGNGALGSIATGIAALYTPPTSSIQYAANAGKKFGIAQPAYAQGVNGSGQNVIRPVLAIWQVSRNIAYTLFIIVFIVIGFMIMFRRRLNPQTVLSVQNALPGIVIALVLVTFSYFLSSLLVDISFLGVRVVTEMFISVHDTNGNTMNGIGNATQLRQLSQDSNILNLTFNSLHIWENQNEIRGGIVRLINSSTGGGNDDGLWAFLRSTTVGAGTALSMVGVVGAITGGMALVPAFTGALAAGAGTTTVVPVLVSLVIAIAFLIQMFRLLWALLQAYVGILVSVIGAPFIILFSALPGRGATLGLWWRTILANSLIFPAVFAAYLFAGVILATPTQDWSFTLPLFGGLSTTLLKLIIAYGIFLGTPAIPQMVRNALGVRDIQGFPQAAMAGVTAAVGLGQLGYNTATAPARDERNAFNQERARRVVDGRGTAGMTQPGARWFYPPSWFPPHV